LSAIVHEIPGNHEKELSPPHHLPNLRRGLPGDQRKLKISLPGRDLRNNGRRNLQLEEKYMRRAISVLGAFLLVLTFATAVLAQDTGRLNGEILDKEGKPYADVTVVIKNPDTGQTYTEKTDKNGKFVQLGMKSGIYTITSTNAKDSFNFAEKILISLDHDNQYKLSVKEVMAQSGPSAEEQKKQAEQADKFKNMKLHFDTGSQALTEANELKTQLRTAPADQKSALQEKRTADCQTAVTELSQAEQGVTEKEVKNHAVVLASLGQAEECVGKFDDASAAFQKAIGFAPQPGYYAELATIEANAGAAATDPKVAEAKFSDASAACDKAIALDPVAGAVCWKNLGTVYFNKGRSKDAVTPLQKAAAADPKDQATWYMLGSSLAGLMDCKQEGDKMNCTFQPGTQEAYQKCIDSGPDNPMGKLCKESLDGLNSMSGGQDTSLGKKKKK
jgi:tetratricopeptide (TPR) repeat protein